MEKVHPDCPLLGTGPLGINTNCKKDRCAWFHLEYHQDGDYTDGKCALLRIADALCRMSNSQTFGNLEKETAAGAGDTNDGKETPHDH